jgi:DNA modification methylase
MKQNTVRQEGQIHQLINTVIKGDCVHLLAQLPADTVDFVLTDPPYIARYRARDGRTVPNDDNSGWLRPAFRQIARVLRPDSFAVVFYGWPHADQFLQAFRAAGLRTIGHLIFPKGYRSKVGFVQSQHEQAYLLAKGEPQKPARPISDVIRWTYSGNKLHPTQKPLSALLPLVGAFSMPGDIVLDPFCGSGSSLLAAKLLGRGYIGLDIDPVYAATAARRLAAQPPR